MIFSIDEIPFSRYGSYFVLSRNARDNELYIRDLHGGDGAPSNLYSLHVLDGNGNPIDDITVSATEFQAEIRRTGDTAQCATFAISSGGDRLHIQIQGIQLRLDSIGSRYDSIVPCGTGRYEAFFYKKNRKIMISCIEGKCERFGEWVRVGDKNGGIVLNSDCRSAYVVLDNYGAAWMSTEYESFENAVENARLSYAEWRDAWPKTGSSSDLAAYLLWANFVRREGALPYDALYCSKNWMNNIWSWDNCFMAIALSVSFPDLAYGQIKTFFHVQDKSGCYPDYVNDVFASYSCCKPPIHAWAFRKMRAQNQQLISKELLREAYASFKKVAAYWLERRVPEGCALPAYNHGNDSGWDNSSVFHVGVPVISPDLAAHIIRQLDILSAFAKELDLPEDAAALSRQADDLFASLMRDNFDGQRFYAVHVPTGERIDGDSLLVYLPIVIGYRLPRPALDLLVKEMLEKFEAPYGLCTENPRSVHYKKGGYWLGPIWAPVTYLIIDALRENGYSADAQRLTDKFLALPPIGKMAENFDAFTGEGFDDPAFSWTSAVYMQLIYEKG